MNWVGAGIFSISFWYTLIALLFEIFLFTFALVGVLPTWQKELTAMRSHAMLIVKARNNFRLVDFTVFIPFILFC
jgi:hypothetical protein